MPGVDGRTAMPHVCVGGSKAACAVILLDETAECHGVFMVCHCLICRARHPRQNRATGLENSVMSAAKQGQSIREPGPCSLLKKNGKTERVIE